MSNRIDESELIINPDGSIFHLKLTPEQIADDIILVGDPDRVTTISKHFSHIEHTVINREFITNTGYYKDKRISVISTGIGTDNIDIAINELDALANIDLKTRSIKSNFRKLNFIRIGTSGALHEDININSCILTEIALGFDGLLNFYAKRDDICDLNAEKHFTSHLNWNKKLAAPYFVNASNKLMKKFEQKFEKGITISAPGFYGPQGRKLRLDIQDEYINDKIRTFKFNNKRITNYEMESSAIYGLSKLLGHNAATICLIIANRYAKKYCQDYKCGIKNLAKTVLDCLAH